MFYLGIDIGKNTYVASLMDKIQSYISQLKIGMEATGYCRLSLYSFLVEQGFVILYWTPLIISSRKLNFSGISSSFKFYLTGLI